MRAIISLAAVLWLGATALPALAQQPAPPPATQGASGVKRTILQRFDVPGTNLETIVAVVELAANVKAGRHSHPGNVVGYVAEGEFFMTFDGEAERSLKAGDSIVVPTGALHDEGTKDKPAKLIATYVVEKDKPLAAAAK